MTTAEQYIESVAAGRTVVASWIKKAVDRHRSDLKRTDDVVHFDEKRAIHALRWLAKNATITEDGIGVTTGDKLRLQAWQQAFIWILFGWRRTDGTRRFRNVYAELARGNGKSKLASAIALYILVGEGVGGSAVYSIATTMEQAGVVFNDAALMAENTSKPDLRKLKRNKNLIFVPGTATVFRPLASNEHNLDGLKPNLIVVDELHAHRSRGPWNKCKTAQGKKPGSMMLAITTAGFDRHSVCYEQRTYAEKVLDGLVDDDSYFVWICALDAGDDPFDTKNWYKSNPNLGISIELQTLIDASKQAQLIPSEYNDFLRLRCNIWTESSVRWMPMDKWDLCCDVVDAEKLKGRPCFGGLDLASTSDMTSFVLVFPPHGSDTMWCILPFIFIPKEALQERVKKDKVPYDHWEREKWIEVTEGKTADYDYIHKFILAKADIYNIIEIGYDQWNAHHLSTQLTTDGLVMVPLRNQGYNTLNSAMKLMETQTINKQLAHGGHVPLRWCVANTVADGDGLGNIRPDKEKSTEKIDGLVATVMAYARASVTPIPKQNTWTPRVWG